MGSLTQGDYPPTLKDEELRGIVLASKHWAHANGLSVLPPPTVISQNADPERLSVVPAPVTLFPSPFPRVCFEQGQAVQLAYNELYSKVSCDEAFLEQTVKEVMDGDEFIRELWDMHTKIKAESYTQTLSLGLFRSDYMVHQDASTSPPTLQAKQVEFNTIASSFGGLSAKTSGLHKYLAQTEYPDLSNSLPRGSLDLPGNNSIQGLAAGIRAAYGAYSESSLGHTKCVIFLVQGDERNILDQRHLEYEVAERGDEQIRVFRLAFPDILQNTTLANDPKRQLLYTSPQYPSRVYEVAVIYFRAGYGPGDYPDASAWQARHHLERSFAIKCPSVLTQLAGTKKVQQVLATPQSSGKPSAVDKYVSDDLASTKELLKTFTNIYPMDTSEAGLEARRMAQDPGACHKYVLKPQREGGGNNIYRGAIPGFLQTVPEKHWGSYILMELITPPPLSNIILRNGKVEHGGVICELGVYGTCLWDQASKKIIHNGQGGYLLRTKGDKSEEGGVAAGFGCMDSCRLV